MTGRKGIVLVHGLTGSPAEMTFLARHLRERGMTVQVPLLPGHGSTMEALNASTYEEWVATVRLAIREMSRAVDEVYVAGICTGGMTGLAAALQEGETVRGAAVYSPALVFDGWNVPRSQRLVYWLGSVIIRIPGVRTITVAESPPYGIKWERLRDLLAAEGGIEGTLPEFSVAALYQHRRLVGSLRKALPRATIPLLLVHAADDDVAHLRNSRKLARLYGGDVRLEVLHDSYHMVHVDQERDAVADWTAEMCDAPGRNPGRGRRVVSAGGEG